MEFIASFLWGWGIALLVSVIFLGRRLFSHARAPLEMFSEQRGSVKMTFLSFVPVWTFGLLFAISVILNIIDYIKAG